MLSELPAIQCRDCNWQNLEGSQKDKVGWLRPNLEGVPNGFLKNPSDAFSLGPDANSHPISQHNGSALEGNKKVKLFSSECPSIVMPPIYLEKYFGRKII